LLVPGGLALSDSKKAEALADSLEAQFQPVNDPLSPALIGAVDEVMSTYKYAPAVVSQRCSRFCAVVSSMLTCRNPGIRSVSKAIGFGIVVVDATSKMSYSEIGTKLLFTDYGVLVQHRTRGPTV
jgi:hypothetical protein